MTTAETEPVETAAPTAALEPDPVAAPSECDVVMKGGITSGVIYPLALVKIGATYRFRGIGGASAGAIGAALGAAAEFGRDSGGFDRLAGVPDELRDGRLQRLFQPQPATRPLLGLMLTMSGAGAPGTTTPRRGTGGAILSGLLSAARAFPVTSAIGLGIGLLLVVVGAVERGTAGFLLIGAGVVLALVGWLVAVLVRLLRLLTRAVPLNLFGICRGLGSGPDDPGFTDWLSAEINSIAGLSPEQGPLRFGHLWTGSGTIEDVRRRDRRVDLRMVSTCLSQGRPYELPWDARTFFYDPEVWASLFPGDVMRALLDAPPPAPESPSEREIAEWRWEESVASAHSPALRRLPSPEHLPVIVATRLSLSFPLLISAVPLWTIDRRAAASRDAVRAYRLARKTGAPPPADGLQFTTLWFTDGGLCSNFPVYLFDSPLPTRPTFAINLGTFSAGQEPSLDQRKNLEFATGNSQGILPTNVAIPESGFAAVAGFASAAFNTARNWQDGTHLNLPGYRDRIVRVLQTKREGGMNLTMGTETIEGLAARGREAGAVMVERFTQPAFGDATGWQNHQWVRYRALLACLPDWLDSYRRGLSALSVDPTDPPSYELTVRGRRLAAEITRGLDSAAQAVATGDPKALDDLLEEPRPVGAIRRVPQI